MGRLLGYPTPSQPVGKDVEQWLRIFAPIAEGIPIGWTPMRESDISGKRPKWYEFAYNVGDIDAAPLPPVMGPRHFNVVPLQVK